MNFVYREAAVGSYLIGLSGPLNCIRSEDVVRLFRDLAERGIKRVMVDMGNVPLIDSRGLAALVAGYKIFGGDAANFQLTAIQDQPRLVTLDEGTPQYGGQVGQASQERFLSSLQRVDGFFSHVDPTSHRTGRILIKSCSLVNPFFCIIKGLDKISHSRETTEIQKAFY